MGGAKNCPETPRQKMIGMMYLVLTAMLALNVSTDILSGFAMVDTSLHASIEASNKRNESMYAQFQRVADKQKEKAGALYDKALEVKVQADSLYNYIETFKEQLAIMADGQAKFDEKKAQGIDPTLHIEGNSNMDVTGTYAIVQGNGQILKENVAGYSNFLANVITTVDTTNSEASLALRHTIQATLATGRGYNAHDKDSVDWEVAVFDGMPIGASMAVLSKMQNDVRTTEGQIVQFLMSQIGQSDLSVNKMDAYVVPNSRNVIKGSTYSAQIILAAVDTTQTPDFYINGVKQTHGTYERKAESAGIFDYSGFIVVTNPKTNKKDTLDFTETYTVSDPAVTISNTELNVMYRDHENIFAVSVPGVPSNSLSVKVTGANSRQQNGLYYIKPLDGAREVTIAVSAEVDGRQMTMGSQVYRIKAMPKPNAYLKYGEKQYDAEKPVPRSEMTSPNARIIASYGADDLLDVPYEVISFRARINGTLTESNGDRFSQDQISRLNKLDRNSTVTIQDIKVKPRGGSKQVNLSAVPLVML